MGDRSDGNNRTKKKNEKKRQNEQPAWNPNKEDSQRQAAKQTTGQYNYEKQGTSISLESQVGREITLL